MRRLSATARGVTAFGFVAGAALACSDGSGPDAPLAPSRLELQFGDSLIELGTNRKAFSLVRASDGTTIYDVLYRWRSDDTTVVRVSQTGEVTAIGVGRTVVRAHVRRDTAGDAPPLVGGQLVVRVTPRVVRRVIIDRDTVTIAREGTVTLVGTPEAADRTPLPERTVSWRSALPSVAVVSSEGTVTGVTPGIAPVIASSEGFADTTWVRVSTVVGGVDDITIVPLPDTLPLGSRWRIAATVRARDGVVLTDRVVSWSLRTIRGIDVGELPTTDSLVVRRRGFLELTASCEGRRQVQLLAVDEPFAREVAPTILRPLDLPGQEFDDTVRVLVTSNTLTSLERLELFLDFRPVAVRETVLRGFTQQRAWETTIQLDTWPFGPLRLEAIGTDANGRRGVTALVLLRIPAEPVGGPPPGGGRR